MDLVSSSVVTLCEVLFMYHDITKKVTMKIQPGIHIELSHALKQMLGVNKTVCRRNL